jgi:hypothetical protein
MIKLFRHGKNSDTDLLICENFENTCQEKLAKDKEKDQQIIIIIKK